MTAKQIIEKVMRFKPSTRDISDMLHWVNMLERKLAIRLLALPIASEYKIEAGEDEFVLPANCAKVCRVLFNNMAVPHITGSFQAPGYFLKDGKLKLVPASDKKGSLVIVYINAPAPYTLENIETKELLLPDEFSDVYEYYLAAQIDLYDDNQAGYMNYMEAYNDAVKSLSRYYHDELPEQLKTDTRFKNIW